MRYLMIGLFSLNLFAASDKDLWDSEIERQNYSRERVLEYKETLLANEAIVVERNSETGVEDVKYYTGNDKNKITLSVHAGVRPSNFSNHQQFDLSYARRFQRFWIEGFASSISTTFEQISENKTLATANLDGEDKFTREDDQDEALLVLGLGTSYRFDMPFDWAKEMNIFHTVGGYVTYNQLEEGLRDLSYAGPGIKAALSVHKRSSETFHYGINFTYNLASVKRDALNDDETNNERRLNLAWYTYGFEVGFYF